jgi:transglutaminase-like putative cysteine protease
MKTAFVCFVFLATTAFAKDIKYPVNAIPEALKKNAHVVVREDETIFKIHSRKSATVHVHYVATIMNSNGKDYAEREIYYDKLSKVSGLKAIAYDANGEVIKRLKPGDIRDRSAFDGVTLFSDNRVKEIDLTQSGYPYTIDVEYDIDYNFLLFIDGSTVASEENVSVQRFVYQLIYPTELKPRYQAQNISQKPLIEAHGAGMESVTWILTDVPPITIEPLSPRTKQIQQIVAAPTIFEMEGYSGSMANWQDLGMWLKTLNAGRDQLPDEARKKVHSLVKGLTTNEEKAKVIYEYLQSKTRYVGIQLGIGGFQPFEAGTVDQTGYGDCKALSNYMVAMLKEVGVPAYYTMIMAGSRTNIDPTFPKTMNHIIVGVPNGRDTLWLECTSQTNPFGYIGTFTDNRYGLMITEKGGELRRTKYYPQELNVQSTVADVDLDLTGNAKAKVVTNYRGLEYENDGLSFILNHSAEDQKKWLEKNTQISSFNLGTFSFTNKKEKVPTAVVKMDLTLNKYASLSNKRIFMTPNLMNRSSFIPEKVENRKTPFVLGRAYTHIDTIRYHIPENIYPEFLPSDTKLTSRFGTYESGFKLEQGSLIYIRKMTRKDGEFPAEAYQELIDFYKGVNKADNTKLVFLNKT